MNKENLINVLKKNKVSIIIGSLFLIGGYWFTHTNFSYHLEDRTGKYILNPEYKEFHKYEFTDLKSVYPTKLAYDPAWFKLPPDKYIPKEQPIPKNISNISDPIIRRQAYFNFLCKTESIDLRNKNIGTINIYEDGILDLTKTFNFSKVINSDTTKNLWYANGNPFIYPLYKDFYYPLIENHLYNFYGVDLVTNPNSIKSPDIKSNNNQFIELMSSEGKIFKVEYDNDKKTFIPIKLQNKSQARFYSIRRFINRPNLINLGINGFEEITFDNKNKILVNYRKRFLIGAFLPWQEENAISNFSWKKVSPCSNIPQTLDNF